MPVTLEQLLCHRLAFGLTTASPVQRAICRCADGLPLGDLAEDPTVQKVFGGAEAIAQLPTEPPKELYVVAAIRSGKSLLSAALALKIALTIDLSFLAHSEIARVSVVSLDRDKSKIIMQHLMGALERENGLLRRYLVKSPIPTEERVRVRRDDGRIVEIVVAAGKRGGGSLVSRWTVAAVFDEACRMIGAEDGVVNFDDMRASVIARLDLLPGAMLVVVSSPWAPRGPIFDAVQTNFGKPTRNLVLVRATGPQMNPVLWTPEACEEVRQHDYGAYRTDVLGEFADPESAFFAAEELAMVTRKAPIESAPDKSIVYVAAMDPATRRNAWTLIIAGRKFVSNVPHVVVAVARQWLPAPGVPLKPEHVLAEIKAVCDRYGVTEVHTDQWASDSNSAIARMMGFVVTETRRTSIEFVQLSDALRGAVLSGTVELPPVPALRDDMISMRKQVTNTSLRISLPVTNDGRHADYVPALLLAHDLAVNAASWVHAMGVLKESGGTMLGAGLAAADCRICAVLVPRNMRCPLHPRDEPVLHS